MAFYKGALILLTFACAWVFQVQGKVCPDLTPVGVDKKFIKSLQPKDGFYANLVAGLDKMPNFKSKPMKKVSGNTKVCYKAKLKINGKEMFDAPQVECEGPSLSEFYCKMPKVPSALAAVGITTPKGALNTIVDTDNKTFMAMGGCLDGSVYMWTIFHIEKGNKQVKESTLKALHITVKDVKDSENKKYKNGRTVMKLAACKGGGGLLGALTG